VAGQFENNGYHEIKSVPETPWSHPFVERAIGTVRREYLDETLFWSERDLKAKLKQFQSYYNEARMHSSINGAPLGLSAAAVVGKISLQKYSWKSYCNGRFSITVPASVGIGRGSGCSSYSDAR
jgi:putative transposase